MIEEHPLKRRSLWQTWCGSQRPETHLCQRHGIANELRAEGNVGGRRLPLLVFDKARAPVAKAVHVVFDDPQRFGHFAKQ